MSNVDRSTSFCFHSFFICNESNTKKKLLLRHFSINLQYSLIDSSSDHQVSSMAVKRNEERLSTRKSMSIKSLQGVIFLC